MKLLKFILKWTVRVFLLLIVAVVLLVIFRNSILRSVVERQIRKQTGMEASIGRFQTSFTSPAVHLQNLRLYNTPDFGGSPLLNIRDLRIEYDFAALRSGKFALRLLRLDLAELNLVRNEAGRMNFDIQALRKSNNQGGRAKPGQQLKFGGIGTLNLSLGKIRYTDLRSPTNNRELVLNVHDEIFKNIRIENDLYGVMFLLLARHNVDLGGGILPLH